MAYKPLLDTTNISILKEIISALNYFDLDPEGEQKISEKVFTQKSLLKELKKQKISPQNLPKILESLSLKESSAQNQSEIPTSSVPKIKTKVTKEDLTTTDYTTNIDNRDLSKLRNKQFEQIDAILKKSTIASIQAKKAFIKNLNKRISTEISKEIDALSWKIVSLDPQINPNTLATTLFKELEIRTINFIPKNQTEADQLQTDIEANILSADLPDLQSLTQTYIRPQKTALWISQVADNIQTNNPSINRSQAVESAIEIRQTLQATALTVNPQNAKAADLQIHISNSIISASQKLSPVTPPAFFARPTPHTIVTKTPLSSSLVKSLDPQLLRIGLVEESQFVLEKITPKLLPTQKLNISNTSTVLNKIRTFSQKPEEFGDFIIEVNNRYQYITTNKSLPQFINSPQTYIRRVFSQIFGKGSSLSSPNEMVNIIQGIPITKPSIPFMPSGKSPSISPKLSGPLKGLGSGLKKLLGKGLGAGKGLLKKGGLKIARGVSKLITMLASVELAPVLATVAIAIVVLVIIFVIVQYDFETKSVFPNITAVEMGGRTYEENQSKYASITKTASPTSLENPVGEITYTYTITPLLGPITIDQGGIKDVVVIHQESDKMEHNLSPNPPPTNLSSEFISEQFSFSLNSSMNDSLVVNTVSITFTNPEGSQETISASTGTTIGNPELVGCPQIWPTNSGYRIVQGPLASYSHSVCEAIDVATPDGSPIYAVQYGTVVALTNITNYGDLIIIESTLENGQSYQHWYSHMGNIHVSKNQKVFPGQIIGLSDSTGTDNAHLHFEYRGVTYRQCPLPGIDPNKLYYCLMQECGNVP